MVVGCGGGEFGEDEVELGAVVEDVGVFGVVLGCKFKIVGGFVAVA